MLTVDYRQECVVLQSWHMRVEFCGNSYRRKEAASRLAKGNIAPVSAARSGADPERVDAGWPCVETRQPLPMCSENRSNQRSGEPTGLALSQRIFQMLALSHIGQGNAWRRAASAGLRSPVEPETPCRRRVAWPFLPCPCRHVASGSGKSSSSDLGLRQ